MKEQADNSIDRSCKNRAVRQNRASHLQAAGPEPAGWTFLSAKVAVETGRTATLAPGWIANRAAWTPLLAARSEVSRTAGQLTAVSVEPRAALALPGLIVTVRAVRAVALLETKRAPEAGGAPDLAGFAIETGLARALPRHGVARSTVPAVTFVDAIGAEEAAGTSLHAVEPRTTRFAPTIPGFRACRKQGRFGFDSRGNKGNCKM